MPPSSLRNVLDGLDRIPTWKVSFEIEPYSWAAFAKSDLDSMSVWPNSSRTNPRRPRRTRLRCLTDSAMHGTSAANPTSVQLIYGGRAIQSVFPDVKVDTYAVKSPAGPTASQLLKSLGYKRAVLKNSTCWGGYHASTLDADLIRWTAPTVLASPPSHATPSKASSPRHHRKLPTPFQFPRPRRRKSDRQSLRHHPPGHGLARPPLATRHRPANRELNETCHLA